ncbi:MAG: type IV secretion system DNA-binding domain-containing protein [bacterium]|nr:type IV secretion system DNA-binding domain-containing protein [bacterium]
MFNPIIILIIGLILLVVIGFIIAKILRDKRKIEEFLEKEYVILSIMVPKNNEKTPLAAEQMFASLHGILKPQEDKQEHISFEIASQDKFTQFYVCVRKELKDFVEGQIYAQYPSVEIKEVPDYTGIELEGMSSYATELTLSKEGVYPIKTFESFEVDPLAAITGVLSKVQGDERIWIQMLTRPVDDSWQDKGVQIVKNMRDGVKAGGSIGQEIANAFLMLFRELLMAVVSPPKPEEKKKEDKEKKEDKKLPAPVETAMAGIETKIQKLGFETKIRIMTVAHDDESAKAKMLAVIGVFRQFNTTNLNSFVSGKIVDGEELLPVFQMRPFGDRGYIFNIEELASIYHFPHMSVETPSIVWAGVKKGEPPAHLPIQGIVDDDHMTILAQTNFRHREQKFGIKMIDRRLHMYSIGKTGTGKSTLMENMIYDDLIRGRGLAVVDPHGQTIDHILKFIPEERMKDVVYLNPADQSCPIGFNLLESVEADQKNIMASGLMSVFLKLWEGTFSARMEYILRNTILALIDYPRATMLGIMRVLNDKNYRKMILSYVKDPVILDFFYNEYEKYDPKFRTEAIAPIQNKVGQFLSSSTIRNIVGQEKSTINISEIMNNGKILLVDLSVGKIGEDNSTLLGSMMITKIQLAAMQRAHVPEEERRDFYLYVDEFQNFATESFATILSEARKYHLNLTLTNQYTAQVDEKVMDAIMGNIGTMVAFRVGAPDADLLAKEFEPVFETTDLINQPNRHIYIKMAIDGVTCPAFSADTLPPRVLEKSFGDEAIEFSQTTYGRPRDEVEQEINDYMSEDIEEAVKELDPVMAELRQEYKEISIKGGYKWYLGAGEEGTDEELMEEPINDDNNAGADETDSSNLVSDDTEMVAQDSVGQDMPQDSSHIISSQLANKIAKKARKRNRNKEKKKALSAQEQLANQGELSPVQISPDSINMPPESTQSTHLPQTGSHHGHHTTILEEGETVDLKNN